MRIFLVEDSPVVSARLTALLGELRGAQLVGGLDVGALRDTLAALVREGPRHAAGPSL